MRLGTISTGGPRVGRLRRRPVVEEPRAALLPDRRRIDQRPAVGMALPGLDAGEGRLRRAAISRATSTWSRSAERRALDPEPGRPGKARAVGPRRGEQRVGIGGERRAEVEDQRARLADAVRRGRASAPRPRQPARRPDVQRDARAAAPRGRDRRRPGALGPRGSPARGSAAAVGLRGIVASIASVRSRLIRTCEKPLRPPHGR